MVLGGVGGVESTLHSNRSTEISVNELLWRFIHTRCGELHLFTVKLASIGFGDDSMNDL